MTEYGNTSDAFIDAAWEASQPTDAEMEAMYQAHLRDLQAKGVIGTLEDVGKSHPICDTCDVVAWDGEQDGDPCPNCLKKAEASDAVR